jgi:hypothetical protein
MITTLKAYQIAVEVCKSYGIESPNIWVQNGLTDISGNVEPICSVSCFGYSKWGERINIDHSTCRSLDQAVKNFELSMALKTEQDFKRVGEYYLHYEEENNW